jgi:predicted transcriptional regulator
LATITIRIDDIEKELLQEYAEDKDTTVSQIIRRLIKEFLDEHFER